MGIYAAGCLTGRLQLTILLRCLPSWERWPTVLGKGCSVCALRSATGIAFRDTCWSTVVAVQRFPKNEDGYILEPLWLRERMLGAS